MPERTAKDIMTPISEYTSVNANDSLKHAILMTKNSLASGLGGTLAIKDDYGNLVGFLTVRTILKALEVIAFKEIDWALSWSGFFLTDKLEHLSKSKVKEVMRPVIKVFVDEDATLQEVARTILKNQVNNIPVINREGKVVGIIKAADVLDVFASFLED